ncbi:unnamed protein product [Sphagnum balticum]
MSRGAQCIPNIVSNAYSMHSSTNCPHRLRTGLRVMSADKHGRRQTQSTSSTKLVTQRAPSALNNMNGMTCVRASSTSKTCASSCRRMLVQRAVTATIGVDLNNMVKRAHLREIVHSIDPTLEMDADTEQALLDMCDDFIENVSCCSDDRQTRCPVGCTSDRRGRGTSRRLFDGTGCAIRART